MCGILYSQDSQGFTDLEMLKRRGPEGFTDLENDLAYFAHSMLNTIGDKTPQPYQNRFGILLYNGSTYNSGLANDTQWIGEKLDGNLDNTLNVIRELTGEYALIYATERNVVFCVDHFENRNLWFYHDQDRRTLTIASVPNLVKQKHGTAWKVFENKIYILDKQDFSIKIQTNRIFDLTQKTNNFDLVFEKLELAVKHRYIPNESVSLLSSGMDSGVINCATQKIFGEVYCLSDPQKEIFHVLKARVEFHRAKLLPNLQGHQGEKEKIFNELYPSMEVWDQPMIDPVINLIKNGVRKRKKKIVIVGNGGDEIYNDRHGQLSGHSFAKTNGSFPSCLESVWPWHNYISRLRLMNMRYDLIAGYFGVEARSPLLDVDLVQAWLNTTLKLKNQYKLWMKEYLLQEKYPFIMEKVHGFGDKYRPEQWKKIDENYHFYS